MIVHLANSQPNNTGCTPFICGSGQPYTHCDKNPGSIMQSVLLITAPNNNSTGSEGIDNK